MIIFLAHKSKLIVCQALASCATPLPLRSSDEAISNLVAISFQLSAFSYWLVADC